MTRVPTFASIEEADLMAALKASLELCSVCRQPLRAHGPGIGQIDDHGCANVFNASLR